MTKQIKHLFRLAHLATAITVGVVLSVSEGATTKQLYIGMLVLIVLTVTYRRLYVVGKPPAKPLNIRHTPDTPIDEQVRRQLGIED